MPEMWVWKPNPTKKIAKVCQSSFIPTSHFVKLKPYFSFFFQKCLKKNEEETKFLKKEFKKLLILWHIGTHSIDLGKSFPMNTNMTGFRELSNIFAILCPGQKYDTASAKMHEWVNTFILEAPKMSLLFSQRFSL